MPQPQFSAAAWAPFAVDDALWLHRREAAAMRWLVQHASGDRLVLCVPSHPRHYLAQRGIRGHFARAASIITLGSGSAHGATFAADATAQLLASAMHAAEEHPIAVTETVFPLGGWAMEVHALDLRTGEVTKDTRTWEQRATLSRLVDVVYKGWSGSSRSRSSGVSGRPRGQRDDMVGLGRLDGRAQSRTCRPPGGRAIPAGCLRTEMSGHQHHLRDGETAGPMAAESAADQRALVREQVSRVDVRTGGAGGPVWSS